MKARFKLLLLVALLGVLMVAPAITGAQSGNAKWTIIYYMALDNDLESFAINDLMEMQAVGSTDDVNIIVQFDRAEGYESTFGDWTDARRFRIEQPAGTTSSGDFAVSKDAMVEYYSTLKPEDIGATQADLDALVSQLRDASQGDIDGVALQQVVPLAEAQPMIPLQQTSIESIGEVNSGDPQTLVDFALWTMAQYPADHYGLFISDHGGGWPALAVDESADNDALTLPEIDAALSAITSQSGVSKLDFVAFDACLESQLEVLKTVEPYADYAIASEQTIPGAGWNYVRPMSALVNNPDMTPVDFGKEAVDGYVGFYSQLAIPAWNDYDLGVLDLSKVDGVLSALDAFSTAMQANPDPLIGTIGDARNNVQIFGGATPDEADGISSVDLIHLMELTKRLSPDAAIGTAAQDVIDAAEQVVVYHQQVNQPHANGLTIFFPRNGDVYNFFADRYPSEVSQSMAGWQAFMTTYYGTASSTLDASALSLNITSVIPNEGLSSIYDPPVLNFDMNGTGIVDVAFIVLLQLDPQTSIMLDYSPLVSSEITEDGESIESFPDGQSTWEFTWNVQMPVVTDGTNTVSTVLLSDRNDDSTERISGIYYPADKSEPRNAYLVFDSETQTYSGLWVIAQNSDSPFSVRPRPGDVFEPTFRYLNDKGELQFIQSGVMLNLNAPTISYSYAPAESGDYVMILRLEDAAGNVTTAAAPLKIDNTDLDPTYRGFKDVTFGVNFLFPWAWSDPDVQTSEDGGVTLIVSSPDGNISIYVESYNVASADEVLQIKLDEFTDKLADFQYEEPEAITIQDNPGYLVSYSYTSSEGEPLVGAFEVVYVESNNSGYSFDLDSTSESAEEAEQVFNDMTNSLNFFPPVEGS